MTWSKPSQAAYRRTPKGRAYRLRAAISRYKRNRAWIDALKLCVGCENCGYRESPAALDFDHKRRRQKRLYIAKALLKSWRRLAEEILKCRVLCANCHRRKTHEQ
jgi:hypothetical protein